MAAGTPTRPLGSSVTGPHRGAARDLCRRITDHVPHELFFETEAAGGRGYGRTRLLGIEGPSVRESPTRTGLQASRTATRPLRSNPLPTARPLDAFQSADAPRINKALEEKPTNGRPLVLVGAGPATVVVRMKTKSDHRRGARFVASPTTVLRDMRIFIANSQ